MNDIPATASPEEVAEAVHAHTLRTVEDEIGKLVRNVIRPLEERVKTLEGEAKRLREGR